MFSFVSLCGGVCGELLLLLLPTDYVTGEWRVQLRSPVLNVCCRCASSRVAYCSKELSSKDSNTASILLLVLLVGLTSA